MPKFYDSKGKTHSLGEEIGRGGEGTVYFCKKNDELVAKIYHEPISDEKAKKLQLMAENKNERLLKVAAWVVETLHDKPNGKVIGFLMPRIKAKEIHELYSLKSRRRHFPQATWHYLIHTSTNLARAFYSLHKYKHVIGDVNHGNCVVLADGTVKLIDCDSYAISDGEKRFRCDVGVATHLAPELQKANLSEVDRKPEHDNFALAIVIFQLLFLGRHPFAGNYLGKKDKTLEDCIREFRFPYGKNAKKFKVKQPPGTLDLDEVSPRVTELFERAFDAKSDNRPTPREWIEALVDMSENLAQCGINPGHRFFNDLATCPWCRIESQTGLMLFPFVFSDDQTEGDKPFNIFTVEKLIENLGNKSNLPVKLNQNKSLKKPEPAKEIVENTTLNRNHQFLFVGGYFIGLVALNLVFGLFIGTILGIFLMIFLFSMLSNDSKKLQGQLMDKLTLAENEWNQIEKEFALTASPKMLAGDIHAVKQKVKDYKDFQLDTRKDLKLLENNYKHRKFTDYLRKFRIENHDIEGISDTTKDELVKKRVWTAAEVEKKRLIDDFKVNSFVANKLIGWRDELEKNYTFEDKDEKLKEKKATFLENHKEQRRRIEKDIEQNLESLQKTSVNAQKNNKLLIPRSEEIYKKILQCKSNLEAVGDTSVALASLILITILVPFFGGIASEVSSPPMPSGSAESYPPPTTTSSSGGFKDTNSLPAANSNSFPYIEEILTQEEANALQVPDKNITDEELESLGSGSRQTLSDNLIRQAIHLVKTLGNASKYKSKQPIKNAFEKYQLARRVEEDNHVAFEAFGKILHDFKFYDESTKVFLDLGEKEVSRKSIDLYIGMNYLELKKYGDAEIYLLDSVRDYPSSKTYTKLGIAYSKQKKYAEAVRSLEFSIQMDPDNVEAHYELGYVYYKQKNKEKFNKQYVSLLNLDEEKASELLKNSYKLPPSKKELEEANTDKVARRLDVPVIEDNSSDSGTGIGRGEGYGHGQR